MLALENIAITAARAAGNFIMRHLDRADALKVTRKGRNDFVTEVDRGAEAEIVHIIRKAYPDHAVLAEEGGADGKHDYLWIIDPLDGTTNFLHGLPHFAVSIGIQLKGKLQHGVIYAPCTQDLYVTTRGNGAILNGRKMRVSKTANLDESLIGTGVPIRAGANLDDYIPQLKVVVEKTAGVRRAGAAALDLAYVACGRLDAFWELNLKPWDMAAGLLMVEEAGGVVCDLYGKDDPMKSGNVFAGNPKMFEQLSPLLRSTKGAGLRE
ncbi:MAG TPA: inositol monophosphatase family protein [Steroidobacteraceae bacterium]|nr:inositol monophosphatase family protein [Steroidobacteraceae bacterium]